MSAKSITSFLFQINNLAKETGKKESQFDLVFMKCLKSFQTELKALLSVKLQVISILLFSPHQTRKKCLLLYKFLKKITRLVECLPDSGSQT